jgi:hypothetical protein
MSDIAAKKERIVDENYKAFTSILPGLIKSKAGKFVVMRDKKPVEFFDTFRDAMIYGTNTYKDELFSVQEITDKALDLGWFSDVYISSTLRH